MYICKECKCEFENPAVIKEKHGLENPPFEKLYVCPRCKSTDYKLTKTQYCHCCGAKLPAHLTDYCSDACRTKGEKLWKKELKNKKLLSDSPLYKLVRETEGFNKTHHTNYSYGQYVALQKPQRKMKNAKK